MVYEFAQLLLRLLAAAENNDSQAALREAKEYQRLRPMLIRQ